MDTCIMPFWSQFLYRLYITCLLVIKQCYHNFKEKGLVASVVKLSRLFNPVDCRIQLPPVQCWLPAILNHEPVCSLLKYPSRLLAHLPTLINQVWDLMIPVFVALRVEETNYVWHEAPSIWRTRMPWCNSTNRKVSSRTKWNSHPKLQLLRIRRSLRV